MIRRLFKFLGWIDRRPSDMWPFPFAGFEPRRAQEPAILVDREGVAYLPKRKIVLRAK